MQTKENRTKKIDNKHSKKGLIIFGIYFLFFGISSYSQCAMCRASLESTGNVAQAEAVNDGIVYLMIIPYVLVALIAFAVYRMFRKSKVD
jgi:Mn2+/Fe2+ NRAMP family transporter